MAKGLSGNAKPFVKFKAVKKKADKLAGKLGAALLGKETFKNQGHKPLSQQFRELKEDSKQRKKDKKRKK